MWQSLNLQGLMQAARAATVPFVTEQQPQGPEPTTELEPAQAAQKNVQPKVASDKSSGHKPTQEASIKSLEARGASAHSENPLTGSRTGDLRPRTVWEHQVHDSTWHQDAQAIVSLKHAQACSLRQAVPSSE